MVREICACANPGTISYPKSDQISLAIHLRYQYPLFFLFFGDVVYNISYCCPRPFRIIVLIASLFRAPVSWFDNWYFPLIKAYSMFGANDFEDVMVQKGGAYNDLYNDLLRDYECHYVECVVESHSQRDSLPRRSMNFHSNSSTSMALTSHQIRIPIIPAVPTSE